MDIRLDPGSSGTPVYLQLVEAILNRIETANSRPATSCPPSG
jgi:DNA-binding transcriptional regulator YhcF (GntR family)